MHAQITIETAYDDGTTNRTHIALTQPGGYQPSVAADLLDKVRTTHDRILEGFYAHDEEED